MSTKIELHTEKSEKKTCGVRLVFWCALKHIIPIEYHKVSSTYYFALNGSGRWILQDTFYAWLSLDKKYLKEEHYDVAVAACACATHKKRQKKDKKKYTSSFANHSVK